MANIAEQTLASIVTQHHQTVPVLEKYHLDFCCKGKRTLVEACTEKGLPVDEVLRELEVSSHTKEDINIPFSEMNAEQLVRHILLHHHFYVRQSMPTIEEHIIKVASKHGDRFPYMKDVLQLFTYLKNEMYLHMQKEEVVLFPRIKEIESFFRYGQKKNVNPVYINGPISVMENEHDEAGAEMELIRVLTNNYTPPDGACTTFKVVLEELKAFEEDLHEHVHLENNLLFPLTQKMLSGVEA
jgi:regulator of cell morphogenesis and NO signaling